MSSTSSGLFCKIAAASENVTPSKLVLFREMRRPPERTNDKQRMNKSLQISFHKRLHADQFCLRLSVLQTWFNSSVFVRRPIWYNRGNEDAEVKFACIVLSHNHKAWNKAKREDKRKASSQKQTHFTNLLTLSTSVNSPNPSFGSFFKFTQTISLSGGVLVGVSTAKGFWLGGKFVTVNVFWYFFAGHTPGKVKFVDWNFPTR